MAWIPENAACCLRLTHPEPPHPWVHQLSPHSSFNSSTPQLFNPSTLQLFPFFFSLHHIATSTFISISPPACLNLLLAHRPPRICLLAEVVDPIRAVPAQSTAQDPLLSTMSIGVVRIFIHGSDLEDDRQRAAVQPRPLQSGLNPDLPSPAAADGRHATIQPLPASVADA